MKFTRYASLEARVVALRASIETYSMALDVDEQAGTIKNAAVMSIGKARGHGFSIDALTLDQVASLINASPGGVKVRFQHPKIETSADGSVVSVADDLGTVIGRLRNARVEGSSVRGDIYLGDYATALPGLGDVRTYLTKRAKEDPTGLGLSAVIGFDVEPVLNGSGDPTDLVARVGAVEAVDFVGRGAATPNGLLAAKPTAPKREHWFSALAVATAKNDSRAIARAVVKLRALGVRLTFTQPKK